MILEVLDNTVVDHDVGDSDLLFDFSEDAFDTGGVLEISFKDDITEC